ncbi:MFS transporter [Bradyrhizobium sp. SZCCHNRI1073]|uniref:MFS transporter n=1 Tax=Bradyrhizobium sp. SZCCHNRI1073 TaxID=3057280 RepID=UPI002916C73A|nr:MFS transporter [Bradyrhizobium sp. SZCCHNRI1073]
MSFPQRDWCGGKRVKGLAQASPLGSEGEECDSGVNDTSTRLGSTSAERVSRSAWIAIALSFAAVLLDGLDTSSIGVAAPVIAAHFMVSPASLTPAFVLTSVGAVLGYLASGPLVSRWQARPVLIASVAAFGVLSLATPLAGSVEQLAALRLITAIGLGAALPSAIAIATSQCPPRLKETAAVIVGTGLAAGGILGGVLGAVLTARLGWQSIFIIGGALPLGLSLVLLFWLPRLTAARDPLSTNQRDLHLGGLKLIGDLLATGLASRTVSLWIFSFLIFADGYALVFWLPALLVKFGFSTEYSQLGISFFSAGGLVANVLVMLLVSRLPIARILVSAVTLGVISAAGLAAHDVVPLGVWLLIAGTGAGLISCSVGQSALAVAIYPEALRTHGVGFSAAAGRIGSIVGPAFAGLLVSKGVAPKAILLAATLPALLAIFALLPHLRTTERS